MTFDEAMEIAGQAIHGEDGRGMVGQGRRHLKQRVARAIMTSSCQTDPVAVVCDGYDIRWNGSGPIAPIIERSGVKVGSKLYAK